MNLVAAEDWLATEQLALSSSLPLTKHVHANAVPRHSPYTFSDRMQGP